MSVTITREEWLAELERVLVPPKGTLDGLTATEIADKAGITRARVLVMLGQAHRQGRLQVGRKPVEGIDGRQAMVPCYRLVPVPLGQRNDLRDVRPAKAAKKR